MSRPNSRPNSRPSSRPTSPASPRKGKCIVVKVLMLDNTVNTFQVPHKASGKILYEDVVNKLQLLEADYFDLEYINTDGIPCWLDHDKPVLKQVGSPHELNFRFGVKFYTPDPGLLEDEYTRYLFALQIKRDLQTGMMPCNENTAALLASYITQAELGDFIDEFTDQSYFQSCKIMQNQTPKIEEKIIDHHKIHVGMTPAEADFNLLDTARKVELYGIKMCSARVSTDHEACGLNLACAHMGVLVFQNYTKINTFSWAKIRKLSFKRKKFLIKLHPEGYFQLDFTAITEGFYKDTVEFYFDSRNDCKNFWKRCIEHHAFFRCQSVKKLPRNKTRVVSRGSSFRYGGRTQKQLVEWVRENHAKRVPFDRSASARASGRSDGLPTSRTNTLNSADHHQSHNSTSSGSHTLDASSKDNIDRVSRVETVDVHSSHSSVGSPKHGDLDSRSLDRRSLDRRSMDRRSRERSLDREGTEDLPPPPPPPPLEDEQGTKPESVFDNDNVEICGDLEFQGRQNEFNNETEPRPATDTSGYNIPEAMILDDEKSLQKEVSVEDNQAVFLDEHSEMHNHRNRTVDSDAESIGSRKSGCSRGSHKRGPKVQRSSSRGSKASSKVDSMEDIPYVLHRIPQGSHPVEFIKTSPKVTPIVKPEKRYVNTVPPRDKSIRPPKAAKKTAEAKRKHTEHLKQIKSVLQNPLPPKSPGRTRAINTLPRNQLPSPHSYSCKDDSMSPSLEKQILEHMKQKRQKQQKAERSVTPKGQTPVGMKRTSPLLRTISKSESVSDDEEAQVPSIEDVQQEALLEALEHEQFIRGLAPIGEVAQVVSESESESSELGDRPDLEAIEEYLSQEQERQGLPPPTQAFVHQYSITDDEDEETELPPEDEHDVYSFLTDEALNQGLPPHGSTPRFDSSSESEQSPSDEMMTEIAQSSLPKTSQSRLSFSSSESSERVELPSKEELEDATSILEEERVRSGLPAQATISDERRHSISSSESDDVALPPPEETAAHTMAFLEKERDQSGLPPYPQVSRTSLTSMESEEHVELPPRDEHDEHTYHYLQREMTETGLPPMATAAVPRQLSITDSEDEVVETPSAKDLRDSVRHFFAQESTSRGLPSTGSLPVVDDSDSDEERSPPLPPPPRFSISEDHSPLQRQIALEGDFPPPPMPRRDSGRRWSEDSLPPPPPPPLHMDSLEEACNLSVPMVTIQAATPIASEDEDPTPVPDDPSSSGIESSESSEETQQEEDLVDFFERRFDSIEQEIDLDETEFSPRHSPELESQASSAAPRSSRTESRSSSELASNEGIPLHNGLEPRPDIQVSDLSDSDDGAEPAYDDNLYTLESLDHLNHPDMMHYSSEDGEDEMSSDCGSEELLDPYYIREESGDELDEILLPSQQQPPPPPPPPPPQQAQQQQQQQQQQPQQHQQQQPNLQQQHQQQPQQHQQQQQQPQHQQQQQPNLQQQHQQQAQRHSGHVRDIAKRFEGK